VEWIDSGIGSSSHPLRGNEGREGNSASYRPSRGTRDLLDFLKPLKDLSAPSSGIPHHSTVPNPSPSRFTPRLCSIFASPAKRMTFGSPQPEAIGKLVHLPLRAVMDETGRAPHLRGSVTEPL
jgi:hypothetical protein